jgi:hypothetical protein
MKGGRKKEVCGMEGARRSSKLQGELEVMSVFFSNNVPTHERVWAIGLTRNGWVKT